MTEFPQMGLKLYTEHFTSSGNNFSRVDLSKFVTLCLDLNIQKCKKYLQLTESFDFILLFSPKLNRDRRKNYNLVSCVLEVICFKWR